MVKIFSLKIKNSGASGGLAVGYGGGLVVYEWNNLE